MKPFVVMNKEEYEKMWLSEDFEYQIILAHKKGILPTPLNVELIRDNLKQSIHECNTGEYIGVGWHGGMTSEEWKKRGGYFTKCLSELDKSEE